MFLDTNTDLEFIQINDYPLHVQFSSINHYKPPTARHLYTHTRPSRGLSLDISNMLVLHDPATLEHKTKELLGSKIVDAYESPERIEAILTALATALHHQVRHVLSKESSQAWQEQVCQILQTSHNDDYLFHLKSAYDDWVKEGLIEEDEHVLPECFLIPTTHSRGRRPGPPSDPFARAGYYAFDMSSGLSKGSWTSIVASANLAIHAANELVRPDLDDTSRAPSVLALCRPPGHHCNTYMAGGYCYINNVVVAIDTLRDRIGKIENARLGAEKAQFAAADAKIAILDVDFHHGNGTQDAYYNSDSVLYLSIHGKGEYPYYSGGEDEIGAGGAGHGFNCNFPLASGSSFQEYKVVLDEALGELAHFKPDYLFISLGFDTFHLDPLGKFDIDTDDYFEMAKAIRSASGVKNVPCAILLEGGYVIEHLGANMLSFLGGWETAEEASAMTPRATEKGKGKAPARPLSPIVEKPITEGIESGWSSLASSDTNATAHNQPLGVVEGDPTPGCIQTGAEFMGQIEARTNVPEPEGPPAPSATPVHGGSNEHKQE